MRITIVDGPMGTQLVERGVPAPAPLWSAWALLNRPEEVARLHREYATAGATVHTANTFRTKRRSVGSGWRAASRAAVRIARDSVPSTHRIAGSIAPIEDCYRPDLSPPDCRAEHRELVRVLADAGVDLLLCETFPHGGEALVAVEEAVATGLETWIALTAGPAGDLMSPRELGDAAGQCVDAGASACLVNCVPAVQTLPFVESLLRLDVPIGVYANAGSPRDGVGWSAEPERAERYVELARQWVDAGVTIVGGCCGTGPQHVAQLATAFGQG